MVVVVWWWCGGGGVVVVWWWWCGGGVDDTLRRVDRRMSRQQRATDKCHHLPHVRRASREQEARNNHNEHAQFAVQVQFASVASLPVSLSPALPVSFDSLTCPSSLAPLLSPRSNDREASSVTAT